MSSSCSIDWGQSDLSAHIRLVFDNVKKQNRPLFSAYTTIGFPSLDESVSIILSLQNSGADIIELGVPFSDPMAEGPTIQKSNQIALDNGVNSVEQCLDVVKQARAAGVTVPLVFMGYYNTFLRYGEEKLAADCHGAGVNGFIIVDLPPEESEGFRYYCKQHSLSYIPLIALTTRPERIASLAAVADSFIYAVSLLGVTGTRETVSTELPDFINRIRAQTSLPIAVGFGISKSEQFQSIGKFSDGIVVGSAIINTLDGATKENRLEALKNYIHNLTGRTTITPSPLPPTLSSSPSTLSPPSSINNTTTNFGAFGGRYVPETLVAALDDLWSEYQKVKNDPKFTEEVESYWNYIGRPSSLHIADRLTEHAGGATIWLKREDLNHTGAHKINNAIAQALLAKRLGKTRLIAETGAGQHGVASATIAAKLGLPLTVYMGAEDVRRQSLNVFRMELLGAKVVAVHSGSKTLKDAINEAMRDWVTNIRDTHYLIGSAIGPHPFPTIVRDFQCVIGKETKEQFAALNHGRLPDAVVACVGGGSNAIGMFYPFVNDKSVQLIGVEAAGDGVDTDRHSATLAAGTIGVLHGTRTYLLQDNKTGQIIETHSISAGLDYPGVGPEHSFLKETDRAKYIAATDKDALEGFQLLARLEGIMPALESSHAVWAAVQLAKQLGKGKDIVICLSGRGDKDVHTIKDALPKFGFVVGPHSSAALAATPTTNAH